MGGRPYPGWRPSGYRLTALPRATSYDHSVVEGDLFYGVKRLDGANAAAVKIIVRVFRAFRGRKNG